MKRTLFSIVLLLGAAASLNAMDEEAFKDLDACLERTAQVTADSVQLLAQHYALCEQHYALCRQQELSSRADIALPLVLAVMSNDVVAVEQVLQNGAKVDGFTVEALICLKQQYYEEEEIVKVVLTIKNHRSCSAANGVVIRKVFPSMMLV